MKQKEKQLSGRAALLGRDLSLVMPGGHWLTSRSLPSTSLSNREEVGESRREAKGKKGKENKERELMRK